MIAVLLATLGIATASAADKPPVPVEAVVVFRESIACGEATRRLRDEALVVVCGNLGPGRVRAFPVLVSGKPTVDATLASVRRRADVESAERAVAPPAPVPVR